MTRARDADAANAVGYLAARIIAEQLRFFDGSASSEEFWAAVERGILELARLADAEQLVKDRRPC